MKSSIGALISFTTLLTACTPPPQQLPTPRPAAVNPPTIKPPSPLPSPSAIPTGSPKVEFHPVEEAPPVDAQRPDAVEKPDARPPAQRYNTQPVQAIPSPPPVTPTKKQGTPIGPAMDCDRDGKSDDSRIDYDGDGIPDDCLIGPG